MSIGYEKARGPHLGDDVVWVDEPDDLYGDGPLVEQQRRHAAEVIKRMDASQKWQRVDMEKLQATLLVLGPDGATTVDSEPFPIEPVEAAPVEKVEKSTQAPAKSKPTQADVRAWASEQGLEVNPMGQVPKKLIAQYIEAHGG